MEKNNEKDFSVAKSQELKLSLRRKAIQTLYDSDGGVSSWLRRSRSTAYNNLFNQNSLERIISQVGSSSANTKDIVNLSNFAYATEPAYSSIIDYLSNFYLWRYYYYPIRIKEGKGDYKEVYSLASEIIDGLNIEITFPMIISKVLREGIAYLYTIKNTGSRTITTMLLNPNYCKPIMISQYGTGIFQFDASYFDSLGARGEELEEVLSLFPEELQSYYRDYKENDVRFHIVDGRYSTYVSMNELNFPSKLTALRSILDYSVYRKTEVERTESLLDKVITHKIPSHDGNLIFDLPEVKDLHASMAKSLGSSSRTKLMTTFGETEILSLQEVSGVKNETLQIANRAIFSSTGINPNLFNDDDPTSLDVSLKRDGAVIWEVVQKLVNFYNLTINHLFNFKNYQIQLNMLHINHYNEKESMEIFRKNAEFGIGKLELIVASGAKQRDIPHKHELEEFLKLDSILTPLKSAHTQSGNQEEEKKEEEKKTQVDETVVEEDLN